MSGAKNSRIKQQLVLFQKRTHVSRYAESLRINYKKPGNYLFIIFFFYAYITEVQNLERNKDGRPLKSPPQSKMADEKRPPGSETDAPVNKTIPYRSP